MGNVATLQQLLRDALKKNDEKPGDLDGVTITNGVGRKPSGAIKVSYDDLSTWQGDIGFGAEGLPRLHAWSDDHVYFKVIYDGAEMVTSVPRHPTDEEPGHYGGG